jgi:hypothetical protein
MCFKQVDLHGVGQFSTPKVGQFSTPIDSKGRKRPTTFRYQPFCQVNATEFVKQAKSNLPHAVIFLYDCLKITSVKSLPKHGA